MIRRPPRSTLDRSSAASDVYKRQVHDDAGGIDREATGDVEADPLDRHPPLGDGATFDNAGGDVGPALVVVDLSLIHISEPTRPY